MPNFMHILNMGEYCMYANDISIKLLKRKRHISHYCDPILVNTTELDRVNTQFPLYVFSLVRRNLLILSHLRELKVL